MSECPHGLDARRDNNTIANLEGNEARLVHELAVEKAGNIAFVKCAEARDTQYGEAIARLNAERTTMLTELTAARAVVALVRNRDCCDGFDAERTSACESALALYAAAVSGAHGNDGDGRKP